MLNIGSYAISNDLLGVVISTNSGYVTLRDKDGVEHKVKRNKNLQEIISPTRLAMTYMAKLTKVAKGVL